MKTLILGGMRSGKSAMAQRLAAECGRDVVYIATAQAGDEEMAARIERHRQDRPAHWTVVEEPLSLARTIAEHDNEDSVILVDCLTLWLTNMLMAEDEQFLVDEQQALLRGLDSWQGKIIFVSNEINMGVIPMDALSRRFCDEAGRLHQRLAQQCDEVALMVAGLPLWAKQVEAKE